MMNEKLTDRAKVTAWLNSIGAPQDEAEEVLANCAASLECRQYFVQRYESSCLLQPNQG